MIFKGRDELAYADGSTAQKVAPVNAAGAAVNPAREDGNLSALLAASDYAVSATYRVTIDDTSQLITALSGGPAALPDALVRLLLVPEAGTSAQIHFSFTDAASTSTPQWPSAGASMPVAAAAARALRVISSGGVLHATLFVMTPRN